MDKVKNKDKNVFVVKSARQNFIDFCNTELPTGNLTLDELKY